MKKFILAAIMTFSLIGIVLYGQGTNDFDPDYIVNREMSDKIVNGYRIQFNTEYNVVFFADPENPMMRYAFYDLHRQYYEWKLKSFDSTKIDLTILYKKINRSKTALDRMMPDEQTVKRDNKLENSDYDYSKDGDFSAFMKYCDKLKVPADVKQFYIRAANNAAKRGKLLLFNGVLPTDSEAGIQYSAFKPSKYKNIDMPYELRKGNSHTAGGMQMYFEFRKMEKFVFPDKAMNIFKDNKIVPLTIVEIDPAEGNTGPAILRGTNLGKRVKKDLEAAFHKSFRITLKKATVSYKEMSDSGKTAFLTHIDLYLQKKLQPILPKNNIIIYYFTDSKRLFAIDKDGTHPLEFGPYATDWEKCRHNVIHEMGHSLQMRHHFSDSAGSSDISTHISPSCIMNYKFSSEEFCSLCRYGLGVNR